MEGGRVRGGGREVRDVGREVRDGGGGEMWRGR